MRRSGRSGFGDRLAGGRMRPAPTHPTHSLSARLSSGSRYPNLRFIKCPCSLDKRRALPGSGDINAVGAFQIVGTEPTARLAGPDWRSCLSQEGTLATRPPSLELQRATTIRVRTPISMAGETTSSSVRLSTSVEHVQRMAAELGPRCRSKLVCVCQPE